MFLSEFFRIGEPRQDISKDSCGKFDQHFFSLQIQVMGKDQFIFFINLNTKINKILFAAGHYHPRCWCVIDCQAGTAIDELDPVFSLRHCYSGSVVKVILYTWQAAFLHYLTCFKNHIRFLRHSFCFFLFHSFGYASQFFITY